MAAPVLVDPGSLLIDAAPGQPASGSVTIASAPADPSVGAAFTSGGDSFEVQSVAVTVQVWHRYTEQEIDELPPSMREAARKAGGYFGSSCMNRGWCHRLGSGGQRPPRESIASAITAQGEW